MFKIYDIEADLWFVCRIRSPNKLGGNPILEASWIEDIDKYWERNDVFEDGLLDLLVLKFELDKKPDIVIVPLDEYTFKPLFNLAFKPKGAGQDVL